jgi:hypothetical protein
MAALSLALLATGLGLIIEGNTTCPTADAVGDALRPLLREEISGINDRLELSQTSRELKIRLLDSRGDLLAARVLPLIPSCEAQAHRVAVIAAAWQAELSEEPLPPAPEIKESEDTQRGARLWPEPAPPARPTPGYFEMGLRLSYVPVGGLTTAFQLGGGAVWGRWGIEGSCWLELSRTYESDQEEGHFFRIAGEFGPTLLVRVDQPEIQLRAQGVASALLANNGALFDPGVEIGARFLVGRRPTSGFLDATVTLWPQLFTDVQGLPLSPVEVFLTVGLVLGGS